MCARRSHQRSGIAPRMSRTALASLAPYVPGASIDEIAKRYGLSHVIKLASNENPLGSSPLALAAIGNVASLHLYADDAHLALKEQLAAPYALASQNVILGHGSNEIVNIVAHALLDPGDEAVMATPTFSLYPLAVKSVDAHPIEIPLRDGVHDIDAMLAAVTPNTRLFFVCDPNNPTGTRLDVAAWESIFAELPEHVTLIVDQAYLEYADAPAFDVAMQLARRENMLVLRTMSKIYGLAALRFGYAYGGAALIATLEKIRLPFNVSALAAAGAMAALSDADFVAQSRALNERGKAALSAAFARLGLHAYPTHANFFAVEIPMQANVAYEALLRQGIIVRSGDGLRMPGRLRITIGTAEQNAALITALETLLG